MVPHLTGPVVAKSQPEGFTMFMGDYDKSQNRNPFASYCVTLEDKDCGSRPWCIKLFGLLCLCGFEPEVILKGIAEDYGIILDRSEPDVRKVEAGVRVERAAITEGYRKFSDG